MNKKKSQNVFQFFNRNSRTLNVIRFVAEVYPNDGDKNYFVFT